MKSKENYKASLLYWVFQLLGWGHFCTLIGIHRYLTGSFSTTAFLQLFWLYIMLISISHLMRFILIRYDWINLKLDKLLPRAILLNFISALILVVAQFGFAQIILGKNEQFIAFSLIINTLVYMIFFLLWTTIYLVYHLYQKARLKDIQHLQLQASHHESELKTLRDQLNPHFLFNSLNSIRALIEIEPSTAKKAITKLSSILRKSLSTGKQKLISLEEELDLIQDYLSLEKIRFEERLNYQIDIQVSKNISIPPFLIQNLIENAVKHGISVSEKEGTIYLSVFYRENDLVIQVKNTGSTIQKESKEGIGLKNIRRRLEIQYEGEANFELKKEDQLINAEVKINKKFVT